MCDRLYNARQFLTACHDFFIMWSLPSFTAKEALSWARTDYIQNRRVPLRNIK